MEAVLMRTIALAAAILLGGCLSGAQPVESADIQPDAGAAAPAAPAVEPSVDEAASEPIMVARMFPFAAAGHTATSVCAPSGPSSCERAGGDSQNTFLPLEYSGLPQSLTATLTWDATTQLTQEMYLSAFLTTSCGDGCYEWSGEPVLVSGPSPLTLDATGLVATADQTLTLHVGIVRHTPTSPEPLHFYYSVEQMFQIEGAVTALVAQTG